MAHSNKNNTSQLCQRNIVSCKKDGQLSCDTLFEVGLAEKGKAIRGWAYHGRD